MKIIRAFPRRTVATPGDENVRIGMPGMFDECDEVNISVCFDSDKALAEKMAFQWQPYAKTVSVGGVAYDDPGGEFEPGLYLKNGYTITSRGCPNKCWFCEAWKNEGDIRELKIKTGWNILDNNLLACSRNHIESVFEMLTVFKKNHVIFSGGLEAARLKPWHVDLLLKIKPARMYFAYDTPDDLDPLIAAGKMLIEAGLNTSHRMACYVLIGYNGDTIENAETRLRQTIKAGFFPYAMLYENDDPQWKKFQREWIRPEIIATKIKEKKWVEN